MMADKSEITPKGEERVQALILAAYHSIAEKGFEGLRLRDVAQQVGLNHATLHHYFPTKEAMVQAVVLYVTQRLAQTATFTGETPMEQLRAHLYALQQCMQDEPALFVVLSEVGLRAQRDPAIRALVQQQTEGWHALLTGILEAGIRHGDWPQDLDAEATASAIIALTQSFNLINAKLLPIRAEQAMKQLERWLGLT